MADIASLDYSAFTYTEILSQLIQWFRANPDVGLTDESPYALHIQTFRSYAYVGHLVNSNINLAANEAAFETAQTLESVRDHLRLIGVKLSAALPASVELIARITKPIATSGEETLIPSFSQFATDPAGDEDAVIFETIEDLDVTNNTDEVTSAFNLRKINSASDGATVEATPDRFTSASYTFTSANVGDLVRITNSTQSKNGGYLITEFIDANTVVLEGAAFVDESSLNWTLHRYGSDISSGLNAGTESSSLWSSTPADGDSFLVMHSDVMWTEMVWNVLTEMTSGSFRFSLENLDDPAYNIIEPTNVILSGGTLYLDVTSLVGSNDVHGLTLTVYLKETSAYDNVDIQYGTAGGLFASSVNYIALNNYLGQVGTISTSVDAYLVSSLWMPVSETTSTISTLLTNAGSALTTTWTLPQSSTRNWRAAEINGVTGFFVRLRVVGTATDTPVLQGLTLNTGDQYVKFVVVQGETVVVDPLGSSTGLEEQSFLLPDSNLFEESVAITIDGFDSDWEEVEDFYSSNSIDNHFKVRLTDEDTFVDFGGNNGKGRIPPLGVDNIAATYRVGGDVDGNVGVNTITDNATGVAFLADITNPRPASGHRFKDGYNAQDIARLKIEGPLKLRRLSGVTSAEDIERAAIEFIDSVGSSPVVRAVAIPGIFGPNTIELVVMGSGGSHLTDTQIDELQTYFNGDQTASPPTYGIVANNAEVTVSRYTRYLLNVTATVNAGSRLDLETKLRTILTPTYQDPDTGLYIHFAGGEIAISQLHNWIHDLQDEITKVTLSTPTSNVSLDHRAFIYPGTISFTVV